MSESEENELCSDIQEDSDKAGKLLFIAFKSLLKSCMKHLNIFNTCQHKYCHKNLYIELLLKKKIFHRNFFYK